MQTIAELTPETLNLLDGSGTSVAQLHIASEEGDWSYGRVVVDDFSPELRKAIEWYDEVVENQMLSFLDDAILAVDQFALKIEDVRGLQRPVYGLQINRQNEVSFRTEPLKPNGRPSVGFVDSNKST